MVHLWKALLARHGRQEILLLTRWKTKTHIPGCPLTSMWAPWHVCTNIHIHEHMHHTN